MLLESLSSALGQVTFELLQMLAGRFSLLCHLTGQHAVSLTTNIRRGRDVKSLLILDHASIFLDSYNEYVFKTFSSRSTFVEMCNNTSSICVFVKLLQCCGQLSCHGRIRCFNKTDPVSA